MPAAYITLGSPVVWLLAGAWLFIAAPADAYIGPGAGFALLSSFLVVFTTILIVLLSLLIWPFKMLWRAGCEPVLNDDHATGDTEGNVVRRRR